MKKISLFIIVIVAATNAFATSASHSLKLKYNDNYEGQTTIVTDDKDKIESVEMALGKRKATFTVKHQADFIPCQNHNNGAMSSKEAFVILKLATGGKHEDLIKDSGLTSLDRKGLVINYAVYYAGQGCAGTPTFRSATPMTLSLMHNFSDQL